MSWRAQVAGWLPPAVQESETPLQASRRAGSPAVLVADALVQGQGGARAIPAGTVQLTRQHVAAYQRLGDLTEELVEARDRLCQARLVQGKQPNECQPFGPTTSTVRTQASVRFLVANSYDGTAPRKLARRVSRNRSMNSNRNLRLIRYGPFGPMLDEALDRDGRCLPRGADGRRSDLRRQAP